MLPHLENSAAASCCLLLNVAVPNAFSHARISRMIINGHHFSHDGAALSYEEVILLVDGELEMDYLVGYTTRNGPDGLLEPGDSIPMYPGLILHVELVR